MTIYQENAILNSLYEKHAAHPGEWIVYNNTPEMRDAVTAGLIEHQENTRLYRITDKGVAAWHKLHGKEAPAPQSAEPRTEAQPPAVLAGDGKQMPEKKRAPKAEPVIEASKAYEDIEDLRSILKSILRDGFALGDDLPLLVKDGLKGLDRIESVVVAISPEFSEDDPLPTADLVHQVTELQTDLEAEKALRAGNLAQIRTLDETVVELTRRNAELEAQNASLTAERDAESKEADQLDRDNVSLKANLERVAAERDAFQDEVAGLSAEKEVMALEIETLGQAAADGQALLAAARVFTEVIERAKKTPEATAPVNATPYKVTNGVKP